MGIRFSEVARGASNGTIVDSVEGGSAIMLVSDIDEERVEIIKFENNSIHREIIKTGLGINLEGNMARIRKFNGDVVFYAGSEEG